MGKGGGGSVIFSDEPANILFLILCCIIILLCLSMYSVHANLAQVTVAVFTVIKHIGGPLCT